MLKEVKFAVLMCPGFAVETNPDTFTPVALDIYPAVPNPMRR
jgi:hypothetical protein